MGERSSNGKFAKGNKGGPGNPYARKVAEFRKVLLESVTEDDFRAIVQCLVEKAKEGDTYAIKELFSRLMGKPVDSPHSDELDRHEAETNQKTIAAQEGLKDEISKRKMFEHFNI